MSFNVKLFLGSIGLAASLLPGLSHAQDASSNFAGCKTWNEDSTPRASELGATFDCLAKKIDMLESQLRPFKAVRGAIVAFDRNRNTEAVCPKGWSFFHPAGGRVVVGAGQHENDLTEYPSYVEDNTQAVGGEERVALIENQMPRHRHPLVTSPGQGLSNGRISYLITNGSGKTASQYVGGGLPHNNMPPYIALYFCKKD